MFKNVVAPLFSPPFSLEIEGSHLSKKVRETISMTDQCLPSLFIFMVPSYVGKGVFEKYQFNDYKSNDECHVSVLCLRTFGL